MKIAILTYGSRGDIQPFLSLSLRLVEDEHIGPSMMIRFAPDPDPVCVEPERSPALQ